MILEHNLNASSFERNHLCLNDPSSLIGHASLLTEIYDCLDKLGWGPYMVVRILIILLFMLILNFLVYKLFILLHL